MRRQGRVLRLVRRLAVLALLDPLHHPNDQTFAPLQLRDPLGGPKHLSRKSDRPAEDTDNLAQDALNLALVELDGRTTRRRSGRGSTASRVTVCELLGCRSLNLRARTGVCDSVPQEPGPLGEE